MYRLSVVLCAAALSCAGCKKSETAGKSSSKESSSESNVADDGQAVTLKVKWPVGSRYTQRMDMKGDTQTTMPLNPKPMAQKVSLNQEYRVTVLAERPKGGRDLELEFESTEIDVTMNGKPVLNLDTRAEADPGESRAALSGFRQLIGAKIKMLLDESNRVEKVEGMQDFTAKAMTGSNPQGRAMMQSLFNEDYFKQLVDFQRGLPSKPVKVGESWPIKMDITAPVLGVLTMDMNYTFKGWEQREKRKCVALDFSGTMASKGDGGTGPNGMTMKLESGTLSGRSWFDPELGHPVETVFNQDMLMHMSVPMQRSRSSTNTAVPALTSQNITNNTKQQVVLKLVDIVSANK